MSEGRPTIVIGAGAAGLMAAIFAAEGGRRPVLLLERTRDGGRKILISGGGRCNVLPSQVDPGQYFTSSSPNTLKKILRSWPLAAQRRFFETEVGIPLALEEESGKLFPVSNRARDVRDGLVELARARGVRCRFESEVAGLRPEADGTWLVELRDSAPITAAAVIIATGGLSVPATGSDGVGLRIARRLGHTVHAVYPALTPLTANPAVHAPLAGISLVVRLQAPLKKGAFTTEGGFLFTHRGYSGPSVLNISHFAVCSPPEARQPILVQWSPLDAEAWADEFQGPGTIHIASVVRRHLPARLADTLLAEARIAPERTLAQLRREERTRLLEYLTRYPLPWTGDEGYKKAEVTGGGVALGDIDAQTMQSRLHPGLFLCGEVLDAFGPIGGYNFHWAWATGRAAGLGARDYSPTPPHSEP